jgi:hypothetical protein
LDGKLGQTLAPFFQPFLFGDAARSRLTSLAKHHLTKMNDVVMASISSAKHSMAHILEAHVGISMRPWHQIVALRPP